MPDQLPDVETDPARARNACCRGRGVCLADLISLKAGAGRQRSMPALRSMDA
jgi:hypothetical protein